MRITFFSRDFALVWIGTLASGFAMNMQYVARGWFVFGMGNLVLDLAWVLLAFTLPQVFFSLPGGILADRYSKRSIIVISHTLIAIATLVMGLLILGKHIEFFHFIVFGVFNGTVLALSFPARQAIVPHVVKEDEVFSAFALNTTAVNTSRVAGPAFAGVLIAWIVKGNQSSEIAVGVVYLVISSLYFLASLFSLLITVPGRVAKVSNKPSLKKDLFEVAELVLHKRIVFLWYCCPYSHICLGIRSMRSYPHSMKPYYWVQPGSMGSC